MGKLTENILGGVKGKIGNLSFANYSGKIIIKSLPKRSKNKPSAKQAKGRKKFQLANTLASKFTPLFRMIKSGNAELTPRKDFFSRIYLAMTENENEFSVDYSKIEFTRGLLDSPNDFALESDSTTIKAKWNLSTEEELQEEIVICLFNPNFKNPILASSKRQTSLMHIPIPSFWKGHQVHGFAFARNENGKVSDSVYSGVGV